jgi:hypothetical protein
VVFSLDVSRQIAASSGWVGRREFTFLMICLPIEGTFSLISELSTRVQNRALGSGLLLQKYCTRDDVQLAWGALLAKRDGRDGTGRDGTGNACVGRGWGVELACLAFLALFGSVGFRWGERLSPFSW